MTTSFRNLFLATIAGALAGITSSLFLLSLGWVARKQIGEPSLLYFLPVAGLVVGGLYDRFGERSVSATNLIIAEIHEPRTRTPGRTTPLIFFTALVSHLFGASVGREGVAVQMGASLADQLSRFFRLSADDRRTLLKAGMAAGFAGALGAPIAGAIFGMEVLTKSIRFKPTHFFECFVAAFVAIGVSRVFRVNHARFGSIADLPLLSAKYLVAAAAFGLLVGLLVRSLIVLTEGFGAVAKLFSGSLAVRAFAGGAIVVGLVLTFGNRAATGLGIPAIQAAFAAASPLPLAFEKLLLTAVSIAAGFRGGEFIPLVFIGATAASAISAFLAVSPAFAAACGISASFGSAAGVPFALSVFGAEHFGPAFLVYALAANAAARIAVGQDATLFSPHPRN